MGVRPRERRGGYSIEVYLCVLVRGMGDEKLSSGSTMAPFLQLP